MSSSSIVKHVLENLELKNYSYSFSKLPHSETNNHFEVCFSHPTQAKPIPAEVVYCSFRVLIQHPSQEEYIQNIDIQFESEKVVHSIKVKCSSSTGQVLSPPDVIKSQFNEHWITNLIEQKEVMFKH